MQQLNSLERRDTGQAHNDCFQEESWEHPQGWDTHGELEVFVNHLCSPVMSFHIHIFIQTPQAMYHINSHFSQYT